jgi:hypothetical protein
VDSRKLSATDRFQAIVPHLKYNGGSSATWPMGRVPIVHQNADGLQLTDEAAVGAFALILSGCPTFRIATLPHVRKSSITLQRSGAVPYLDPDIHASVFFLTLIYELLYSSYF